MNILGISAYYHDSAAALVRNGVIVAAAQEERFTRKKHDNSFPVNAIRFCLGGMIPDAVAFYEKPLLKFDRILKTYCSIAPKGFKSFVAALPLWLRKRLWIPMELEKAFGRIPTFYPSHHMSHAASAFYPSSLYRAAILTMDGVGEWATTTQAVGCGNDITFLNEIRFPHSLGLLYSAFTYHCGFKVNSGEYKLMGLAPYGVPKYADIIRYNMIDIKRDGSFRLNMDYFGYLSDLRMTSRKFEAFFGPRREPESEITQHYADIAASIQKVTEDVVLKMAYDLREKTGEKNLCMAGGVALNCVANGKLLSKGWFDNIWIQPASGDAGGAVGAALTVEHLHYKEHREEMHTALLGPSYYNGEISEYLQDREYSAMCLSGEQWAHTIAKLIGEGRVVGVFRGPMEFGPRALGARSILADARNPDMQRQLNMKIKHRESFRPFAPAVMAEHASTWFDLEKPSPFMLFTARVRSAVSCESAIPAMRERLSRIVSSIPAVTHVDGSARIQTVTELDSPWLYKILKAFYQRTGCPVVINTSFNVRGEPIVGTPEDAYRCFMRTDMDALVLEDCLLLKENQPPWNDKEDWRQKYGLD